MVNGSSQQKKYILFSSSIFYTIFSNALQFEVNNLSRGAKQGGGVGGVSTPPEFWMGG